MLKQTKTYNAIWLAFHLFLDTLTVGEKDTREVRSIPDHCAL